MYADAAPLSSSQLRCLSKVILFHVCPFLHISKLEVWDEGNGVTAVGAAGAAAATVEEAAAAESTGKEGADGEREEPAADEDRQGLENFLESMFTLLK